MSRHGWKRAERHAAALIGGRRYPANTGGPVDCESATCVAQVKARGRLSLAELTTLAVEMERVGRERGKHGLVIVKCSAGRGRATPYLVTMTAAVWQDVAESGGTTHPVNVREEGSI